MGGTEVGGHRPRVSRSVDRFGALRTKDRVPRGAASPWDPELRCETSTSVARAWNTSETCARTW